MSKAFIINSRNAAVFLGKRAPRVKFMLSMLLAALIGTLAFNPPASAGAGTDKEQTTIGEYFDGEELTYNIDFWWFKQAAVGKIGIHKKENGVYEIRLTAETLGFIGFITKRKDLYKVYIEETNGGRRFRVKRFEKIINIGGKTRQSYTEVDYNKMTYHWKSWGVGREEKEATEPIPPGTLYDDPLTGFYNFRFGVYGAIQEGKEFDVPTFPVKGVSIIHVKIATNDEKRIRVNPDSAETTYLTDIVISKELFGSQTGKVEVSFNKELIPVQTTAKDLLLFGDVRGRLIEMTLSMKFKRNIKQELENRNREIVGSRAD